MTFNLIELITKPKLQMTVLDDMVLSVYGLLIVAALFFGFLAIFDRKSK